MDAIKVSGLTKKYSGFTLGELNFTIPQGCIVGFVGENGAGKTTTIKAILGLIRPDEGSIEVLGHDAEDRDASWREQLGVVFDESYFPENITARDIGKIMSRIYRTWEPQKYAEFMQKFALPEDTRFKDLSRGMKMKLSIAAALSHDTHLLILDEATSGLDPVIRGEVLDIFRDFIQDEEHTIFMSSHITADIEKAADYIIMIHQGKILLYEDHERLLEEYGLVCCGEEQLQTLDPEDIISSRRGRFNTEVLVKNRRKLEKRGELKIDAVSLDDLLTYMVKKEER